MRPAAVITTPAHSRPPTAQPNSRWPSTASITTPVESTTWTTDSGASASAATWRIHAPRAITMPSANHEDRNRARALRSGWRMSTGGACVAPRCLQRKPSCVAAAHSSASPIPRFNVSPSSFAVPNPTYKVAARARRVIGPHANARTPALEVLTTFSTDRFPDRRGGPGGRAALVVHAEPDLHRHLVVRGRAAVDTSADLGDLEPVEPAQRLVRPRDGVVDGLSGPNRVTSRRSR